MTDGQSFWVGVWWVTLSGFSVLNIVLWAQVARLAKPPLRRLQALLCGILVAGCAFRSFLPRADVQRICLLDSWLSSVAVGRSVATIAELCIVAQWALYLYELGRAARAPLTVRLAKMLVPLISVAEVASWYAVLTTNYLGNVVEQSLWTLTATLCAACLVDLYPRCGGTLKRAMPVGIVLICLGYVPFMLSVDIPMYLGRLRADTVAQRAYLSLDEGMYDASHRWIVTYCWSDWHEEMAWMLLYFTAAVWTNIALIRAPEFEAEVARRT
jgi:hypothetical protein